RSMNAARIAIRSLAADAAGAVWFATDSGLWRFRPSARAFELVTSAVTTAISVAVDREGGVWVGERIGGLTRIRPSVFQMYAEAEGLEHANTVAVFADSHDRVWVGTRCSGVAVLTGSRFHSFKGGDEHCGYSFAEDSTGAIWIGGNS